MRRSSIVFATIVSLCVSFGTPARADNETTGSLADPGADVTGAPALGADERAENRLRVSTALGTISRIYRYPVKSLAAEPLDRATIEKGGIAGDRRSALFVASETHARAGKTYRGKENELLHTVDTKAAALALAESRGVALDVRDAGPYFDASPVSIVFDTWIGTLENIVYQPIDELRFRANVYVRADPGFSSTEEELVGKRFRIGDVRLSCTSAIVRCVTPTYDIPTGERDPVIARAIAVDLENILGVYCSVEHPGEIERGARLHTED